MIENRLIKLDAVFIFFCGLFLFTLGLQHQEIIGFESRFYLFALEMWRHGLTWFPTTYQEPYPDYPVTSTVFIYFTAKLFGTLNKWVAVFPSAVAAALTLSATYLIGATQERKYGWYSVGFLIFTLAFLTEARTISLDMYVAAATTWIFYFAFSASVQNRTPPWWVFGLLLVISFSIRGPVGIIIPAGVLSVFYLLEKNWKSWMIVSLLSAFLLVTCTGILLDMAWHVGGNHFMQDVIRMEVAGRMKVNRTPPHYFYFVESIGAYAVTYLLALLVLAGKFTQLFRKNASPEIRFLRLLAAWLFVIMLGLSIPADKKVRYILSVAPALALVCSCFFVTAQTGFLCGLKKVFYWICKIFPLLALGILFVLYHKHVDLSYGILSLFFIAIQIAMLIIRNKDRIFCMAVITFFTVNVYIVEKINLQANQTRNFVLQIESLREKSHARLAFYHEGRDGFVIKYLINMPREEDPLFISDVKDAKSVSMFLVSSKENFYALPENTRKSMQVIATGKMGRDDVMVTVFRRHAMMESA